VVHAPTLGQAQSDVITAVTPVLLSYWSQSVTFAAWVQATKVVPITFVWAMTPLVARYPSAES
jgi:hypothetical protein